MITIISSYWKLQQSRLVQVINFNMHILILHELMQTQNAEYIHANTLVWK